MFYHDLLKKELFDYINLEYSKRNIKDVPNKSSFNIEIPTNKKFGDVSTNIAMVFAKKMGLSPRDLAFKLSKYMNKENCIEKLEVVGPGFLNIFFKKSFWHDQLKVYFKNVNSYNYKIVKKNICLEFVSANPTGLMHIGHARGAVLGDTIASVLEEVGHKVTKEYYINDAGEQIKKLKKTIKFHVNNKNNKKIKTYGELYPGDYLKEISKKIYKQELSELMFKNNIIKLIMNDIKKDLLKIKITHDSFVSEKECSSKKNIDEILKKLNQKKLTYYGYQEKPKSLNNESWEKKKLLLFKSQEHGDETDRALIKSNGELTYFMTDIIYHQKKVDKKFDILLNIWGSDHSGYVKRLQSALEQLNKKANYTFEIKLTSLVNLLNDKQVVKMSKREGNYVTLREVVEKVGPDVLRYMMISRSVDKTIDFDFEIVKSKSKDNPVFYIQYAYARCMSLITIYEKTFNTSLKNVDLEKVNLSYLNLNEEIIMIIKICNFFNVIIKAAKFYEPHRIANYLFDIAKDLHAYWGLGKVDSSKKVIMGQNSDISLSRIALIVSISKIIKKGMNILKIECPENM